MTKSKKQQIQSVDLLIDYIPTSITSKGIENNAVKNFAIGDMNVSLQNYDYIDTATDITMKGLAQKTIKAKLKIQDKSGSTNPWDLAHFTMKNAKGIEVKFAEPDIISLNKEINNTQALKGMSMSINDFDPEWPAPNNNSIWHLSDRFSQLKSAREAVANLTDKVRVAHLDTGLIKGHIMLPDESCIRWDLQKSFGHDDNDENNASDRLNPIINGIGHGTSTISLLAGKKVNIPEYNNFNDYLGGAPWAEVVPIRVSRSVVLLRTSSFVEAANYVLGLQKNPATACQIITMSMGGLPTKAWADVVNTLYDNGIILVAASGDNVGGLPTKSTVYPARFGRAVNAVGVCYDYTAYYHGNIFHTKAVQGNFGPEKIMDKAIAAFTPNVPWVKHLEDHQIDMKAVGLKGAGTSSATPQIAAAAANYYRKYYNQLKNLLPWQRVEAVRTALYQSASKNNVIGDDFKLKLGNGILNANAALAKAINTSNYVQQAPDNVRFPLFHLLFKGMAQAEDPFTEMIELEILQLVSANSDLETLLSKKNGDFLKLTKKQKQTFIDIILEKQTASNTLKKYLKDNYTDILTSKK